MENGLHVVVCIYKELTFKDNDEANRYNKNTKRFRDMIDILRHLLGML